MTRRCAIATASSSGASRPSPCGYWPETGGCGVLRLVAVDTDRRVDGAARQRDRVRYAHGETADKALARAGRRYETSSGSRTGSPEPASVLEPMTRSGMFRRAFPDGSPASKQRTDPAFPPVCGGGPQRALRVAVG
jgi:hypothetical protein